MKVTLLLALVFGVSHCSVPSDEFLENSDELAEYRRELARLKEADLSVADLISGEGYTVEEHVVTTTDGYILKLHRIPSGKSGKSNGKVAYLQHGLLSSSADWIITGPGKALAYLLADEGYDVWLGNARGNTQSRKHISLNPDKDSAFWKFSWHEIATLDVPQMIDYVLEKTGVDGVYYVGHSQGTTVFYVMTSVLPEYNSKIKVQVSLAPIGFMNHMTSPLMKYLALWEQPLDLLLGVIGVNEFLPTSDFIRTVMSDVVCSDNSVTQVLCTNALFVICGFSTAQMNTTLLPIMMQYTPAGSSTKQMMHYAQEINSGKFRQYDWGMVENLIKYKQLTPPDYDLSKISAPVYLIYSLNDWLSAETDVNRLCSGLGNCAGLLLVADTSFNHLDYMFGIDAPTLVYNKVVSLFARY